MAATPAGARPRQAGNDEALVVGLVNNMPDTALQATEQQFRRLITAAAGAQSVELHLIALPGVPRSDVGRRLLERGYEDTGILRRQKFDGLIVTGAEPRSAVLEDEPYWEALARLIDWARGGTHSTIWSCLAAHAAVRHLDGIARRRLPEKLYGLFACPAAAGHRLSAGLSAQRRVPHSRFNDLAPEQLRAGGYEILAGSPEAGADFFVKDAGSLFVFLQGHPEYDRHALLREYRRDAGRYLSGERDALPQPPRGYLAPAGEAALQAFAERARASRDARLLGEFPKIEDECPPHEAWGTDAVTLYRNWIGVLAERRAARARRRVQGQASAK
jgi:homoserine O-succinyltransferase